jgi:hypothetical protein
MEVKLAKEALSEDLSRAAEAFEKELTEYLSTVEMLGAKSVEIRTDWLYSRVEGLTCDSVKMLLCMRVMKDHMLPDDEVLDEPDDFDGRFLEIRFQLPRKTPK